MFKNVVNKMLAAGVLTALLACPLVVNASTSYSVPTDSDFKSFMDFRTITSVTSAQYKLQRMCTTTESGLRIYNGRYTVAVGTYFNAPVGTYIDVHLSTGQVLQCVVGDIKKDIDTDANNIQAESGNVVEFIVDESKLPSNVKTRGTVSVLDGFDGYVTHIVKYTEEDMSTIYWQNVVSDLEETSKFLVTDKYTLTVADTEHYIVEYASATDFNTVAVDKELYDSLIVYYSVIEL